MFRLHSLTLALLLMLTLEMFPQVIDTSDEAVRRDIMIGYGFCQGQKYGLERISSAFPDVKMNLRQSELKFDALFGKSCSFFDSVLSDDVKQQADTFFKNEMAAFPLTSVNVTEFLGRMQDRANGKIESPFLETLLTWHPDFKDNPDLEITRGFTKTYSTKGHPKAKGLHLEVQVPISWKSREGTRPNIIQYFRAKNGFSDIAFSLMVRDVLPPKGTRFTQRDIDAMFSTRSLRDFVDEGEILVESKPIVLEGLKGGFWVIDSKVERLDRKIDIRMVQYGVFFKNRFIFLQFMILNEGKTRSDLLHSFETNRELFNLVANSLVIMDKY